MYCMMKEKYLSMYVFNVYVLTVLILCELLFYLEILLYFADIVEKFLCRRDFWY